MADIDAKIVMDLRARTGAGLMDCKKALTDASGDVEKATIALRAKGAKLADKKSGRAAREGFTGSYIHHNGRLGVMVEVMCETDFVARNEQFREFARKIAMHIAAASPAPICVRREQVPADLIERERAVYVQQVAEKPEAMRAKIAEGKLNAFYKERVLLEQVWSMGDGGADRTVEQAIKDRIAVIGENIVVRRFVRFDIGDDVE